MKNATLSLNSNESEPKYYPIEVLLKSQNQELPEDVNPAKKEVCGCGTPHRLKHQAQEMALHSLGTVQALRGICATESIVGSSWNVSCSQRSPPGSLSVPFVSLLLVQSSNHAPLRTNRFLTTPQILPWHNRINSQGLERPLRT